MAEQHLSNALGEERASRFPGLEHPVALLPQELCRPGKLGRFPASFDALEGDEEASATPPFDPHDCPLQPAEQNLAILVQVVENSNKRLAAPCQSLYDDFS